MYRGVPSWWRGDGLTRGLKSYLSPQAGVQGHPQVGGSHGSDGTHSRGQDPETRGRQGWLRPEALRETGHRLCPVALTVDTSPHLCLHLLPVPFPAGASALPLALSS